MKFRGRLFADPKTKLKEITFSLVNVYDLIWKTIFAILNQHHTLQHFRIATEILASFKPSPTATAVAPE